MKIPKNMSEEQVLSIIDFIIGRIAPRYTFKGYDIEDIKQESFIICIDALERYDQKRPLENFLAVHLSNRLKNFVRDNHYVKDNDHKKKVISPQYITDNNIVNSEIDFEQDIMVSELFDIIDIKLPAVHREDYLKLLNNIPIHKSKKDKILSLIKEILKDEER